MLRRFWTAIRIFFATLFHAEVAQEVARILTPPAIGGEAAATQAPEPAPKTAAIPQSPLRSDAITLLATLQREARFVDFIQEPLAGFSDAQIGAAVRDVHRDCGRVLERLFSLKPIVEREEGSEIEAEAGFDPGRYRLSGNVAGEPPFRGRLRHHGWEATICQLPSWSGTKAAARTIAPVEIEL